MIPGFDDTLKNSVVPAAPASAGNAPSALHFPGMTRPTTDMQAVRDGRRSTLQSYLVDLSVARSIAAGTALQLGIQGNVFMSDPLYDLTGVAQAGIARVHFQDVNTNNAAPGTYCTVLPTAVYRVPFTQVLVENYAQAGKFLYIVYGTDVDVVPGGSQQVSATIINAPAVQGDLSTLRQMQLQASVIPNGAAEQLLLTRDLGFSYGASQNSSGGMAANTPETIFTPAANVNGAMVWAAHGFSWINAAAGLNLSLLAKTSAPASVTDGDAIASVENVGAPAAATTAAGGLSLKRAVFIPAGKGLYWISGFVEAIAKRGVLYTLL